MTSKSVRHALGLVAVVAVLGGSGCIVLDEAGAERDGAERTFPAGPSATDPQTRQPAESSTPQPSTQGASSPAPSASHSAPAEPQTPDATPESPSPSARVDQTPVVTRLGTIERRKVRGELFPLYRNGASSVINLHITKVHPSDPPFRLRTLFNDGDSSAAAKNESAVDGFRLIEGRAKKVYIPATTGNGTCLCTPASNTVFDRYDEVTLSVVFASPPTSVTSIDVLIPVFGTVSNVPVH